MEKVKEEWPVAKERKGEVWTSEVTLEPVVTEVPEIGSTNITVEVRCCVAGCSKQAEKAGAGSIGALQCRRL